MHWVQLPQSFKFSSRAIPPLSSPYILDVDEDLTRPTITTPTHNLFILYSDPIEVGKSRFLFCFGTRTCADAPILPELINVGKAIISGRQSSF
jgi:hypothetical protein